VGQRKKLTFTSEAPGGDPKPGWPGQVWTVQARNNLTANFTTRKRAVVDVHVPQAGLKIDDLLPNE